MAEPYADLAKCRVTTTGRFGICRSVLRPSATTAFRQILRIAERSAFQHPQCIFPPFPEKEFFRKFISPNKIGGLTPVDTRTDNMVY